MTVKSDLISSVYVATIVNDVPVVIAGVHMGNIGLILPKVRRRRVKKTPRASAPHLFVDIARSSCYGDEIVTREGCGPIRRYDRVCRLPICVD